MLSHPQLSWSYINERLEPGAAADGAAGEEGLPPRESNEAREARQEKRSKEPQTVRSDADALERTRERRGGGQPLSHWATKTLLSLQLVRTYQESATRRGYRTKQGCVAYHRLDARNSGQLG